MKLTLLMAATLDGVIAKSPNDVVDWTGKVDKKYFSKYTKDAGVVIMGSKTHETIGCVLPDRLNIVMTRRKCHLEDDLNLIYTDNIPFAVLSRVSNMGYTEAVLIGGSATNSLFLEYIDEIQLVIVPRLFGKGLSIFNMFIDKNLELKNVQHMGEGHVLVTYRVEGK